MNEHEPDAEIIQFPTPEPELPVMEQHRLNLTRRYGEYPNEMLAGLALDHEHAKEYAEIALEVIRLEVERRRSQGGPA